MALKATRYTLEHVREWMQPAVSTGSFYFAYKDAPFWNSIINGSADKKGIVTIHVPRPFKVESPGKELV